ncbi:MAG: MBL fold metallo-hydrolase [Dehalococcoidia bacterium]|jgi:L-ascorbate metabolism protein UlaG (beta-lactamase superfamily)
MQIAWHGSASISIRVDGVEILFDPHFSKKEQYGDWYEENPHAPKVADYLAQFSPGLVLITHGHFDHFDLHTVDAINQSKQPVFTGSTDVIWALQYYFQIPGERLLPLTPRQPTTFKGLEIRAFEGVHWITREEGTRVSEKLRGRPERYGVMPCGGPSLGIIITGKQGRVYISGDTLLEGIPQEEVDYAIIFTGGLCSHPVTKEPTKIIVDPQDIAMTVENNLKARAVIPVHYDFVPALEPLDVPAMVETISRAANKPKVVIPPYHTWIEV